MQVQACLSQVLEDGDDSTLSDALFSIIVIMIPVKPVVAGVQGQVQLDSGNSSLLFSGNDIKPVRHVAGTGMPRTGPREW